MITCELKGMDKLLRELRAFGKKGVAYAARETVNELAKITQSNLRDIERERLTIRNNYLPNKTLVDLARVPVQGRPVISRVGLAVPFGKELEDGGRSTHASGRNPVPGAFAGGAQPGQKRTHKVFPTRSLAKLSVLPMVHGKNKKQTIAIQLRRAKAAGRKAVLLPRGNAGGTGIYAISGGKRRTLLKLLYATGIQSVTSGPHPILAEALGRLTQARGEAIMLAAIQRQVDRWTSWSK